MSQFRHHLLVPTRANMEFAVRSLPGVRDAVVESGLGVVLVWVKLSWWRYLPFVRERAMRMVSLLLNEMRPATCAVRVRLAMPWSDLE